MTHKRRGWIAWAAALACLASEPALAVGLTYVDADDGFATGTPNLAPLAAINSLAAPDDDNKWEFREFAAGGSIFEASVAVEDAPEITQTLGGLTPGVSYDVYVAYWTSTDAGGDWPIRAGFTSGNLTLFNYYKNANYPDAVTGVAGGAMAWDVAPPDNPTSSDDGRGSFVEANRGMVVGKVGTMAASGSGEITVFIDDLSRLEYGQAGGVSSRTWLDGLAYAPVGTTVALSAVIDRDSGQMTLVNNTDAPFTISGYSITSAASGLVPAAWDPIAGDMSIDTDPWTVTAPTMPFPGFAGELAESEDVGGSGGALLANGSSWNLGMPWVRTPFEDVEMTIFLPDGTEAVIRPTYTGEAIVAGDFDANGDLDEADYATFIGNWLSNVSTLTRAEAYALGDINGSLTIDYDDFIQFRAAFDAANGAGAFAAMGASVPEPGTWAMLLVGVAGLAFMASPARRKAALALAGAKGAPLACLTAIALAAASATAAPVTGWTVDNTFGGGLAGTPILSDAGTASPIFGDGSVNNIDNSALYASFPEIALAHGEQVTLSGSVTVLGGIPRHDDFRWGLFKDNGDENPAAGWRGLMASNSDGTSNGVLYTKNPGGTAFLTTTWASIAGNRAVVISQARDADASRFLDGTYNYSMTLARYGDEIEAMASLTDGSGYSQSFRSIAEANPARVTFAYDRVGFLAGSALDADQMAFSNVDVSKSDVAALTLRVNNVSGLTEIVNESGQAIDIAYYQVGSAAGALNLAGWTSLDDGEGPDPVGMGWDEAAGSTAAFLAEGNLQSVASLANLDDLSLGNAFTGGGTEDLIFRYGLADGTLLRGFVEYVSAPTPMPDLNMDGKVDIFDVAIVSNNWANSGAPGTVTGDANKDGVVDIFDVALISNNWNPGGGASAVPEPSAMLLGAGLLPALLLIRRRMRAG